MANNKERKRSHKKTPNQSVSSAQSESAKPPAKKKSPKPTTPASRAKKPVTEGSVSKPANRANNANGRRADRERKPSPSVVSRGSAAATMTMTPEPSHVGLPTLQPCQVTSAIQSSHLSVPSALTEERKPTPKKRRSKENASNQPNKRSDERDEADTDTAMTSPSTASTASMLSTPTPTPASPARSALHQELQAIYHRVCQLEDQCGRLMQKLAQEINQQKEDNVNVTSEARAERLNRLLADATKRHAALLDAHYDFLRAAHYNDSSSIRGLVNKYDIPSRLWSRGVYAFVHIARNLQPYAARYLSDHLRHCAQILLLLAEPYFDREADGKNLPSWTEAVGDLARIGMSIRTDDAIYWRGVAHWWYSRALLSSDDNGRPHHHFALVLACRLESLLSLCRATLCMVPFAPATNTMDALFNAGAAKMQRQGEREPLEVVVDSFISIHEGVTKSRFPEIRQKLISLGAVIARTPSPFLASRAAMFAAINIAGLHEYGRGALAGVWKDSIGDEPVVVPSHNKYVAFHILRAHLALTSDKALPHLIPWLLFMLALSKHPKVFLEVFDHRFPWKDMLWYLNEIRRKTSRPTAPINAAGANFNFRNPPPPREKPPTPTGYVSKLPEELLLRGFSWAKGVPSCSIDYDTQDIVNSMSLGGQLDYTLGESGRLERAQDLIRQLGDTRMFQLDDSGLGQDPELASCMASKRDSPDYISEYEAYHEFLPDIGGDNSSVTSDDIQSLCKKRDMVRQECGVQSKIENLELTTSPLAGERKPAIVFDTNLWLDELEFIVSVVEGGWLRIKVPVVVMYELQKLQTFNRDVRKSTQAQQALSYIKSKGQGSGEVEVVGLDGAALNEQASAEGVVRISNEYGGPLKRCQPSMDELITRTVCKLQKGTRGGVVRALLVSNDKNMRILALTQSVVVSSGAEFMNMYGEESGERRNETPGIRSMRSRKSELSV